MKGYSLRFILMLWLFSLSALNSAEEYIIGVEKLNFLPYYSGIKGTYSGYARDVLDAFGKAHGHEFKYHPLPVERLFLAFINHQVDFKFPDSPNWQQELKQGQDIAYSRPIAPFTDGMMVKPGSQFLPAEQFRKLGTIRGFTPWPYARRIEKGEVVVYENNSIQGLLMQTVLDRVDGSYINVAVAQYHLKNIIKKPDALVFNSNLAHDQGHYFLSSIKYPELIAQFNAWLKQNSEQIIKMQKQWNIVQP